MSMTAEAIHKFELAGLGKAPFRYVGVSTNVYSACPGAPAQPGGSCDYCGAGIMYEFSVQSADGKRFKVGCDCICKIGDAGLKKQIDSDVRRLEREKRHAREDKQIAEGKAWIEAHREQLSKLTHPYFSSKSMTAFIDWMFQCAGNAGKLKAIRLAKKAAE